MKEFNSKEEMIEYINQNCNIFNFYTFKYYIIRIDNQFKYYEIEYLSENFALEEREIVKIFDFNKIKIC
jgi:hypothetical protein